MNPVQIAADVMHKWQQDWAKSTKGRWTYRLISNIGEWTRRNHGHVKYYLTQLLTGNGCYRAYLYKYGYDVDEACPECRNKKETAKHTFFACPGYIDE